MQLVENLCSVLALRPPCSAGVSKLLPLQMVQRLFFAHQRRDIPPQRPLVIFCRVVATHPVAQFVYLCLLFDHHLASTVGFEPGLKVRLLLSEWQPARFPRPSQVLLSTANCHGSDVVKAHTVFDHGGNELVEVVQRHRGKGIVSLECPDAAIFGVNRSTQDDASILSNGEFLAVLHRRLALALLIGDEEAISYKQRLIPATVEDPVKRRS